MSASAACAPGLQAGALSSYSLPITMSTGPLLPSLSSVMSTGGLLLSLPMAVAVYAAL